MMQDGNKQMSCEAVAKKEMGGHESMVLSHIQAAGNQGASPLYRTILFGNTNYHTRNMDDAPEIQNRTAPNHRHAMSEISGAGRVHQGRQRSQSRLHSIIPHNFTYQRTLIVPMRKIYMIFTLNLPSKSPAVLDTPRAKLPPDSSQC